MKHMKHRLTPRTTPLFASTLVVLGLTSMAQAQGVKYDFAYPISGAERARPSQVYDDGKLTYIQTKRTQGPWKVFAITRTGERELVKKTTDNCSVDCVAVEGTYEELRFASEGMTASAKYSGNRQNLPTGVQSYGAVQPMVQYGNVGSTTPPTPMPVVNKALVVPPDMVANADPRLLRAQAAGAPMIHSAASGVMLAQLSPQSAQPQAMNMVLGPNAQGQPTTALLSNTGGVMPVLDGTVIDARVKGGYQAKGQWVKDSDLAAMRSSLDNLSKGSDASRLQGDYNFAKANCAFELAVDVHKQARNNGVTEHLLHSAAAYRDAAMRNQITSYRTPILPGEVSGKTHYPRQNADLWRKLAELHQLDGARCAPAVLACASVQLLGAEFKRGENYPGDAVVYETKAKQMIAVAEQTGAACPPVVVPKPAAVVAAPAPAPVVAPAPVPQAAPPLALRYTTDTVAGQTLFGLDNASLSPSAIVALKRYADNVKATFRSIASLDVVGYADRLGAAARNQLLSEKRAVAVKDWLVEVFTAMGMRPTIVNASGAGSTKPVTGTTCDKLGTKQTKALEDCLAPDRRVEITLLGDTNKTEAVPAGAVAGQAAGVLPHANSVSTPMAAPAAVPVVTTTGQVQAAATSSTPFALPQGASIAQQLAALDAQRNALQEQLKFQQAQANAQQLAAEQERVRLAAHEQAIEAAKAAGQRVYKEMMDAAMRDYKPRTAVPAGADLPTTAHALKTAQTARLMADFSTARHSTGDEGDAVLPPARYEPMVRNQNKGGQ
jgi:outer membrane protein OmpA-like peptidoglycan-associated protein